MLHATQRITRTLSQKHGAFPIFTARLRDALLPVVKEDLQALKCRMLAQGMTEEEWEKEFEKKQTVLIKHCRRFIPGPEKLLPRMVALEVIYANIPDARTRLPFFSKKTWIKWNALKDHVRVGCLSDPPVDEVPLYSERGIRKDGSVVLACSRGTNGLEGYHQKVARVASGKNVGPQLAQGLMSEFTFRWNMKMALLSYRLPRAYDFFYEQYMIEEVQLLTRYFYPDDPLYHEWRSSKDFACTGETFGVVAQTLPGPGQAAGGARESGGGGGGEGGREGGGVEAEEDREEEEEEDEDEDEENGELTLAGLTASARWLAKQTLQHPPGKVSTEEERKFFRESVADFAGRRASNGDVMGDGINFTAMTVFWNKRVQQLRRVGDDLARYFRRKTPLLLKSHHKVHLRKQNSVQTMSAHRQADAEMAAWLRTNEDLHGLSALPPPAPLPADPLPPRKRTRDVGQGGGGEGGGGGGGGEGEREEGGGGGVLQAAAMSTTSFPHFPLYPPTVHANAPQHMQNLFAAAAQVSAARGQEAGFYHLLQQAPLPPPSLLPGMGLPSSLPLSLGLSGGGGGGRREGGGGGGGGGGGMKDEA